MAFFNPTYASSRFQDLSKKLVATARGDRAPEMYWELKNKKLASGDDISAIVVGLQVSALLLSFSQALDINSFISLFGSKLKPLGIETLSSFPARQAGAF